jgi:uncharacterized protein (TIGR02271 family)
VICHGSYLGRVTDETSLSVFGTAAAIPGLKLRQRAAACGDFVIPRLGVQTVEQSVVIGLFSYASEARRSLHTLHQHGFSSDQVTAAFREAGAPRRDPERGGSSQWFGQLRQLYRGDETSLASYTPDLFASMLEQIDLKREDAAALDADLSRGAGIIMVRGERIREAEALLQRERARIVHGQDRRLEDHADSDNHVVVHSTPFHSPQAPERDHIQLFGEVLRVHKETVSSGDVRVRKEAITRMENVQVPVTREHLVVDHPGSNEADGEGALRIPLSEERVHIDKETVLREEYKVGKREVTQNEIVTDTVKKDRLLIDDATRRDTD